MICDEKSFLSSKTEIVALVGAVSGLLVALDVLPTGLSVEQIAGIASVLYALIMFVRALGGGKIVSFR